MEFKLIKALLELDKKHDLPIQNHQVCERVEDNKKYWNETSLKCKFIFVKIKKCASSTIGGVTRRIASNHKEINYAGIFSAYNKPKDIATCAVYATHDPKPNVITVSKYREKYRENTFIFTFIRSPGNRALSEYFHLRVSREKASSAEVDILKYIKRHFRGNYMVNWMASSIPECKPFSNSGTKCIELIIETYDFIGLVERIFESLVVFKLLNNLTFSDILFVKSSKTQGSYDDKGYLIQKVINTPNISKALEEKLNNTNCIDKMLYEKVNQVLDSTIEVLGQSLVERQVKTYKTLLKQVEEYCKSRIFPPYGSYGKNQIEKSKKDCYWNDNGCGKTCLDEYVNSRFYHL